MHADSAAVEGGTEHGEDEERHDEEDERETDADSVEGCHVLREPVHGNTGVVVREGDVGERMSPPRPVTQTDLLSTGVLSVEKGMLTEVTHEISEMTVKSTSDTGTTGWSWGGRLGSRSLSQICLDRRRRECLETRSRYTPPDISGFCTVRRRSCCWS